jgi:hypothetical protein
VADYSEMRLVEGKWVEKELHSGKSRRKVMKKLVEADPVNENGDKAVVQRKVRLV